MPLDQAAVQNVIWNWCLLQPGRTESASQPRQVAQPHARALPEWMPHRWQAGREHDNRRGCIAGVLLFRVGVCKRVSKQWMQNVECDFARGAVVFCGLLWHCLRCRLMRHGVVHHHRLFSLVGRAPAQ